MTTRLSGIARRHIVLGAALLYFVLLGGAELGPFLPIRVLNGIIGAAFVVAWIRQLPQRADLTDRLVLGALLAFLAMCILSAFPRTALDAAADAIVYAAVFSVTRWELRGGLRHHRPDGRHGARGNRKTRDRRLHGMVGLVAGVGRGGRDAPATRRTAERRAVPAAPMSWPCSIALLAPAMIWLIRRRIVWVLWSVGLVFGTAVVLMAGGRAVWAAIAVVAIGWVLSHRLPSRRMGAVLGAIGLVVIAIALVTGIGGTMLERLGATSTIELRAAYWIETLQQMARAPIEGWGPRKLSTFITLGDYFDTQAFVPRHADNAVIQLLGEGGVIGLVALGLIAAAVVVGARRTSTSAQVGIAGVALFCLLSITDNPSDTASLAVVGIMWAAIACPPDPALARQSVPRARALRFASLAVAGVAALAIAGTAVAAAVYERASAEQDADPAAAISLLEASATLDPGLGPVSTKPWPQALGGGRPRSRRTGARCRD